MAKKTRKADRKGKHLPSVQFEMRHPVDGRIFILVNDIGHRKVSVFTGDDDSADLKAGRNRYGKPDIHVFGSRDEVRDYVEFRLEAAEAAGFHAV